MHPRKRSPCRIEKPLAQRKMIDVKRHKHEKKIYTSVSVFDERRKVSRYTYCSVVDDRRKIVSRNSYQKSVINNHCYTRSSVVHDRRKVSGRYAYESSVIDIDRKDVNNPLAVVEYVNDLYRFYKFAEKSGQVGDYMHQQSEIDEGRRMILVDLLVSAHNRLKLAPEVLYLAVNIVDRYLAMNLQVTRNEFHLVGLSALVLAVKYEEDLVPPMEVFVSIADGAYSTKQISAMENFILRSLEWNLSIPTMYHFLVRFIKAAVADKELENTVFFLAELSLMQYGMLKYSTSLLAASAVYAARCTLERTPSWDETLRHYTGYSEYEVLECAKQLSRFHSKAAGHKHWVTIKKYSSCERHAVALLSPAKSLSF